MTTKRVVVKKGERAELHVRRINEPKCDGKSTGGRFGVEFIGPVSISIVIERVKVSGG